MTESGIIIFNVKSGSLIKKARLEVLLDDGYWPCLSTVKARSTNAVWEYVGEGFIREVDFSRVWLRLNEADEGDKDDIIAEWKGDAKQFLKSALVCRICYAPFFGGIHDCLCTRPDLTHSHYAIVMMMMMMNERPRWSLKLVMCRSRCNSSRERL